MVVIGRDTAFQSAGGGVRSYLSVIFVGSVCGALLIQFACVAKSWSRPIQQAPIVDPSPLPCKKQSWYNADRICLSWTAPRERLR
jgi:hypothetical protein